MKNTIGLLMYFISFGVLGQSVFFGERTLNTDKFAVYFDQEGSIYPSYLIPDNSISKSGASLHRWYKEHPDDFVKIAKIHNCTFKDVTETNINTLEDSIVAQFAYGLNKMRNSGSSVSFLVHGFRKPFHESDIDYNSPEDFLMLEDAIKVCSKKPTIFVEVYWDALYDCCFGLNLFRNEYLFGLFEKAQVNATAVAPHLRKVLNATKFDNVNVISHSLGAKVVTQALFNVNPADSKIPTPDHKRINIGLIAPAIAGIDVFKAYYQRTTAKDFKQQDNYRLAIVYNLYDAVLNKKVYKLFRYWGPGPFAYGVTTLGCNYDHEAENLKDYFTQNFTKSEIVLFDRSGIGTCHYLGQCYCADDNLRELVDFMQ